MSPCHWLAWPWYVLAGSNLISQVETNSKHSLLIETIGENPLHNEAKIVRSVMYLIYGGDILACFVEIVCHQ